MSKLKAETESGFVCEVDESALNDMELLEDLIALDEGDGKRLPAIITRLLGEEGKRALYDHVREDGRVPIDKATAAVLEIMKGLQAGKN